MRFFRIVIFGLIFLLTPLVAFAQTPGEEATCIPGEHTGVSETDVQTAVAILCEELQDAGVNLTENGDGDAVYRLHIRRLGELIWLTLVYDSASTGVQDFRRLEVGSVEEIPIAARRLVNALLNGQSVEETAAFDTLVGGETRDLDKLHGEFLWGLGLMGVFVPSSDAPLAPGFSLSGAYETVDFAVGTSLRFGAIENSGDSSIYFDWSLGGRYFFLDGNISPFVGGGMEWLIVNAEGSDDGRSTSISGNGLAAFAEVGVEFLRFHDSRLTLDLRLELPVFEFEVDEWSDGDYLMGESVHDTTYVTPITVALTYYW